jgi:NifU-like protein involved in Fe-S cluster formation
MLNLILKQKPSFIPIKIIALYHDNVIDHYEKPRNVGSLDKNKKNVGTGLVGAPACGDVMKLQI